ncbi:probable carboxylesterase 7 [Juglans regia]|uniref:Probable carboxylesterase 7 n=2 Tax=Juglans regia TaxID=51240 RepID=A0A6P9EDG0_JUGRE|nr:probable carboxylesterase 7 [Juglans regia]
MNQPLSLSLSSSLSLSLIPSKFCIPRRRPGVLHSNAHASSALSLSNPVLFRSSINQRKASHIVVSSPSSSSPRPRSSSLDIDASSSDIAVDYSPFIKIYKDGRVERMVGTEVVPPSLDRQTGVESKDVVISPETGVSARLYRPNTTSQTRKKLPLLVYFHGGGFCVDTAFSPRYHRYLNSLVAEANVVAVSVDYRRAPEHPVPVAYDDSWDVLKWVASHVGGKGPDEWLKNQLVDFGRVVFAGDSAGATIAHHMGLRVGAEGLSGVKLQGIVLVHPYFWGKEPIGGEVAEAEKKAKIDALWRFIFPATSGCDDPNINPATDPKLGSLGCGKVLVCVAEEDLLRDRGLYYRELLENSEWGGVVEVMETSGEGHVFHLDNPDGENAVAMLDRIVSFINWREP